MSEPTAVTTRDPRNPIIAGLTIEDIGILPEAVAQINQMAERPDVTAEMVAGPIERDPTLTSKVLRILNSAYYGLRREVRSISHAVAYLGILQIRNIVVSSSVIEAFAFQHGIVDPRLVWEHSLGCAIGAKRLGDMIPELDGDGAYLGGLLHDLGRIVFISKFAEEYGPVVNACERGLCTIRDAEESRFGITHQEAGFILGEAWEFSDAVLAMIRHHHDPAVAGALAPQAAVVGIANSICHSNRLRFGFEMDDEVAMEELEQSWTALMESHQPAAILDREQAEKIVTEAVSHAKELVADLF
jgi:HD-like signal output (HDOD) protein